MKVEYPLQLLQKFNRKILTNKIFTYFLTGFIIAFTIILRTKPYIYYKYLYNPFVLIVLILLITITITFNKLLGIMLSIFLIALFFPSISNLESIENFENEGEELAVIPVSGEDKNIVDDSKIKSSSTGSDSEKEESEDEDDEEKIKKTKTKKTSNPTKSTKKENFEEEKSEDDDKSIKKSTPAPTNSDFRKEDVNKDELSAINLEKIHVGYFKNKDSETQKKSNTQSTEKFEDNRPKKTRILPRIARLNKRKERENNDKKNDKTNKENFNTVKKNSNDSETFLGDVRQIINDLDKGKNKMNAKSAIKQINTLMFTKHKTDIQKIIDSDEDSDDEDDSDLDDYY